MKKLVSLLLLVAMLFSLTSVMAEDEPIVITRLMSGDNTPAEDNLVLQEIEKRLGIRMEVIYVSGSDLDAKRNALIAANDMPDIFGIGGKDAEDLRDAGKLAEFSAELAEYGKDIIESTGDDLYKLGINAGQDGKIYGIRSNTEGKIDNMVIRKDWLEAVGMEVPTSLDELYEVLKAFTFNDPDGNGADDTYGMSCTMQADQNWEHFFGAYGIAYNKPYLMEDGTVTTYMKAPDYLTVIEYLRKLYKEGIMDPDFATLTNMQTFEKLWNGQIGFYAWESVGPTNNWYPGRYTFEVPENPEDIFAGVHFEGVTGAYKQYPTFTSYTVIAATCEHVAEAVKLLNYLCFTEEGMELTHFGVEGVMFEWLDKENGKFQRLGDYVDDATHRAAGAFVYGAGWTAVNAEIRTLNRFTQQLQAEERAIATNYPYIIASLDSWSEYGSQLTELNKEAMANLIVCEDDELEAMYAEYVQRWEDEGGLEYEEEATAQYKLENNL